MTAILIALGAAALVAFIAILGALRAGARADRNQP